MFGLRVSNSEKGTSCCFGHALPGFRLRRVCRISRPLPHPPAPRLVSGKRRDGSEACGFEKRGGGGGDGDGGGGYAVTVAVCLRYSGSIMYRHEPVVMVPGVAVTRMKGP